MALSTFAGLKAALLDYLVRSDLSASVQNDLFTLAEARIWYGAEGQFPSPPLRARQMQSRGALTVNEKYESLASDYLDTILVLLSTDPITKLQYLSNNEFNERWVSSQTAKPLAYTIIGSQIAFGPTPDTTYSGEHWYYAKPTALSADGDTNWLISASPGVYLYAALLEAQPYLKNPDELPIWHQAYLSAVGGMNAASKSSLLGGVLRMTPSFTP